MKTLMVDMDNVITDGVFKEYIEEFYGKKLDLEEIKAYTYVQEATKENSREFCEFVKEKDFYFNAPLFEGCYEALEKLNKKFDLYIVTSYLWNEMIDLSGNNLKNKYYYLKEKLPFIGPEKYIFSTTKKLINFDIRIDDRLDNLVGAETKLLFSAWHNRDIGCEELKRENVIRVDSWFDVLNILERDS